MSIISQYVDEHSTGNNALELLPLMHSCDCFAGQNILKSDVLKATECSVFHKNLLYFFYGKPAYPVADRVEGNRSDTAYLPICFIVPLDKVSLARTFPFDTGAFMAKPSMYQGFLHHKMEIDSFELNNTIDGIRRYIEAFFGDNEQYLCGDALDIKQTGELHIDGLVSLLHANGTQLFDERANTVEIMTEQDVPVSKCVECIILPEILLDETLKTFLDENGIRYYTYPRRRIMAPNKYHGAIVALADQYLKDKEEEK